MPHSDPLQAVWQAAGMSLRRAVGRVRAAFKEPQPQPSQWDRLAALGLVEIGDESYERDLIYVHEFWQGGLWLGGRLQVGAYCSLARCEIFLGGGHHVDHVSSFPFRARLGLPDAALDHAGSGNVTIGSDVWVGHDAIITSGVTIGHGAVIGTRALVTKDVPPYAIVGGTPARVIRERFDEATVGRLLELAWWNWPKERVLENIDLLGSAPDQSLRTLSATGRGPSRSKR